jgi:hypothetical protein
LIDGVTLEKREKSFEKKRGREPANRSFSTACYQNFRQQDKRRRRMARQDMNFFKTKKFWKIR